MARHRALVRCSARRGATGGFAVAGSGAGAGGCADTPRGAPPGRPCKTVSTHGGASTPSAARSARIATGERPRRNSLVIRSRSGPGTAKRRHRARRRLRSARRCAAAGRHHRFESLFEQRVFLDIRERGYATVPQYKVYGRRIDIVVVGSTRKLAVECDGAEWHGAEQYDQDLARQRDLERAGWTFFRIRDIDYYLDSQVALEPLWTLLQELDIHPRGMGTADDVREHPTDQSAPDRPTSATARQTGAETAVATAACTEPPSAARTEPPNSNEEPDRPEPIERAEASELEQYVAWDPSDRHMPSAATTAEPTLRSELLEIVVVEGPVVTERVYQLRNRASGLARLGGNIRSALDRAADVLAAQLSVVRTDPLGTDDSLQMTLRLPNQPEARPRTLGPRGKLDHVPPEELAAVLQRPDFLRLPREQRYRSVLALYGFSRLTAGVEDRLRRCDQTAEPSTAGGDSLRSME